MIEGIKGPPPLDGFKLVSRSPGGLVSYTAEVLAHFAVRYSAGAFAFPRSGCGPLSVFDSLDQARDFLTRERDTLERLVSVAGVRPRQEEIWACLYHLADSSFGGLFAPDARAARHQRRLPLRECPAGTRLARCVKLVECLYRD